MLKHARSETLLSQRSFAHRETLLSTMLAASTLAAKPGEHSKLRPHSKLPIVEASTHSNGSKLRYTHSFSYFRKNRSTVLASLRRAGVSVTSPGGHCREHGVKSCSNGALTSPLGEVNAPFETQVSAYSYYIFEQSRNF